jgi:hypothetical protein
LLYLLVDSFDQEETELQGFDQLLLDHLVLTSLNYSLQTLRRTSTTISVTNQQLQGEMGKFTVSSKSNLEVKVDPFLM